MQFYSDGAVNVDGISVFPPNVAGLPDLGAIANRRFVEDRVAGLTANVGDLFGLPGAVPLAPTDIVIFSDGDAPEPATLLLSIIGLVGVVSYAWRSKRVDV